MFHSWLRKSFALRGQDVLSFGRDSGGINLLDGVHLNLVLVVVLLMNAIRFFRVLFGDDGSGEVIPSVV